jgi:hypothetical protein
MSIDLIPEPLEAFAEAHPGLVETGAALGLGALVVIAAIGGLRFLYRKAVQGK